MCTTFTKRWYSLITESATKNSNLKLFGDGWQKFPDFSTTFGRTILWQFPDPEKKNSEFTQDFSLNFGILIFFKNTTTWEYNFTVHFHIGSSFTKTIHSNNLPLATCLFLLAGYGSYLVVFEFPVSFHHSSWGKKDIPREKPFRGSIDLFLFCSSDALKS